jgi:hypothetical protein
MRARLGAEDAAAPGADPDPYRWIEQCVCDELRRSVGWRGVAPRIVAR